MKLSNMTEIKGKITLLSGLHIGAGDMEMHIGGTDNPVIKHPHTLKPYIPGSSVKGKVRSLLEMRSGLMSMTNGAPLSFNNYKSLQKKDPNLAGECAKILKLFGCSGADTDEGYNLGPSRLSFADLPLNKEWDERAAAENLPLTEVKSENSIDRIRGTARNPRFTERVPAEAEFDFRVTIKEFEGDEDLQGFLLEGLKLLEMDALGGSGSRGYGRLRFEFDDSAIQAQFDGLQPF